MAHRSPARWMAPLALLAAVAAVGLVVNSATGGDGESSSSPATQERTETGRTSTGRATTGRTTTTGSGERRSYTVKAGDTLGTIAEETGIPIEELQELNPDLDPQSLRVGQRIKLR